MGKKHGGSYAKKLRQSTIAYASTNKSRHRGKSTEAAGRKNLRLRGWKPLKVKTFIQDESLQMAGKGAKKQEKGYHGRQEQVELATEDGRKSVLGRTEA